MTILSVAHRKMTIKCECGHVFAHSRMESSLVKCFECLKVYRIINAEEEPELVENKPIRPRALKSVIKKSNNPFYTDAMYE